METGYVDNGSAVKDGDSATRLEARFIHSNEIAPTPKPKPGKEMWPEWFKRLDKWLDVPPTEPLSGTVKACSPFADALSAGYIFRLPGAVRVVCDGDKVQFSWRGSEIGVRVVETHSPAQVEGSGLGSPYKWLNYYGLVLPEGWSALVSHPFNRHDLPFRTFTGFVDDAYTSPLNFPFEWIGGEGETLLDSGMPVAQVVPIQRFEWQATFDYVPNMEVVTASHEAVTHLEGYRRKMRQQKVYR